MLSMEERKRIIQASVEAAEDAIPVAASIQFVGTRQVIELARYAHEAGAVLGQLSAPFYYPPPSDDIFGLFKAVSDETDLPIMIYSNWWNTLNMNTEMVERLAALPNVVALKWSAPTPTQFTEGLYRFADRLAIIDNAGMMVWSHMLGAVGYITHLSNFWPEYPLELWDLLEAERYRDAVAAMARFQWPWLEWVHEAVAETEGEGPFIKAAMTAVGLECGPPRPPARPLSAGLCQELAQIMGRAGVPRLAD
jgi:4-hydroxy-tetrahydrodipicolinate synthase